MAGITLPQFSPVKRKRDRKDPARRVGDAAYEYSRRALLKRVREVEERARQEAERASVVEDDINGWEDEGASHLEDGLNDSQVGAQPSTAPDDSDDETPNVDDHMPTRTRCTQPSTATQKLYHDWKALLPHLVRPLALFQKGATATGPTSCGASCSGFLEHRDILCLYWNHFETRTFEGCRIHSESFPITLVRNGLFPTSPREPRVAVSIDLLSLYQSLLEHSGTSNSAFCSALQDFYLSRGFWMLDAKGIPIHEPFRRGFGSATKWYGCVKLALEDEVDALLSQSRARIPETPNPSIDELVPQNGTNSMASQDSIQPSSFLLFRGHCSELLRRRCPACFAGTRFGRSQSEGCDVHVAVDCNFNQRHRTSAGDCPAFYDPCYILSKDEVDAAGHRIEAARRSGARKDYSPKIPDVAVDEDEKSFEAADEKKEKTHGGRYDDTGLAALVCRHDIPLFLANVDTAGEQHKYAVALVDHLASHLPPTASIAVLYDIGCVMDRSMNLYDIFPPTLSKRLLFATSVMHAYGHQWSCQLVYNPRLRIGLGLTDGEGVERFWSRLHKLIGITRSSARQQRIYLLDRQAAYTASSIREDLGGWIRRKVKDGIEKKGAKARADIESCGKSVEFLRQQWNHQRQTQTSMRSHAPAQLKKELDAVLTLQAHADTIEAAIRAAQTALNAQVTVPHLDLSQLYYVHQQLCAQIDHLYTSLNVGQSFPELAAFDVTFVQTLLLARDLKMNIRKRAIGTFFEWDRLDQATGGHEQALGTKLHQQTRKSIARCRPALLAAIRKFNGYIGQLEEIAVDKGIRFPLPRRLSTDLSHLKNDDDLLQDVWTQAAPAVSPAWLIDADVRRGIRAMLQLDRCLEECRRLGLEADNMLQWYGHELIAIQIALQSIETDSPLTFALERRYQHVLVLQHRWKNPFISDLCWHAAVQTAPQAATAICQGASSLALHFLQPMVLSLPDEDTTQRLESAGTSFPSEPDDESDGDSDAEGRVVSDDEAECLVDILDSSDFAPPIPDIVWDIPLYYESDTSEDGHLVSSCPEHRTDFYRPSPELLRSKGVARYRPRCAAKNWTSKLVFDANALSRLYTPTGFLNDDAINRCVALLAEASPTSQAIVFSTYNVMAMRNGASPDTLWRQTRKLQFWKSTEWIIPIHREHQVHWTVATVNWTTKSVELFDSLADRRESARDIQDVLRFIDIITTCAGKEAHQPPGCDTTPWKVKQLLKEPVQHNGYDCGVWILAQIHARLHGQEQMGIQECDISAFRDHCLCMVLALATWNSVMAT
ncbi:hypothetical protein IW262DRAFT_1347717 [Armillaria fumosa]|nr:hypothetical protein IW262DRAFT_1347717 [Armillaria fumosa]